MLKGVTYHKIDDKGIHISIGDKKQYLEVDNVIICAGQISVNELHEKLKSTNKKTHLIGGAKLANKIDAQKAIKEGFILGMEI